VGYLAATSGSSSGGGSNGESKKIMSFSPSGNEEIENVGTNVGDVAPNFASEEENFSLRGHRGEVVILDFMATWCPGCKEEIKHLKEVRSSFSTENVSIISVLVSPRESKNEISEFKEDQNMNWIVGKSPEVGLNYGVNSIPTIYILNKDGEIHYRNVGVVGSSTLKSKIGEVL
ncbi:MAG: TlpA family protein disulfide reductase, partial [Candidatus Aenigmatarchaeota archaeon]